MFEFKGLDDLQKSLDNMAKPENMKKMVLTKGIKVECPNCHTSFTAHSAVNNCPGCSEQIALNFKFN